MPEFLRIHLEQDEDSMALYQAALRGCPELELAVLPVPFAVS